MRYSVLIKVLVAIFIVFGYDFTVSSGIYKTDLSVINKAGCKLVNKSVDDKTGSITFEINGNNKFCKLRMWQCGAEYTDGSFQVYNIYINDNPLSFNVAVNNTGWCFLEIPQKVYLKEGINKVKIECEVSFIPNIEFIEILSEDYGKEKLNQETEYDKYIKNIKESLLNKNGAKILNPYFPQDTISIGSIGNDNINNIPYSYDFKNIEWFGYTFYSSIYIGEKAYLQCTTKAKNNIKHFIEVFKAEDTNRYSWTSMSDDNGIGEITVTGIPEGLYFIKVRPYLNGTCGLCDIVVDNRYSYKEMPISSMGQSIYINSTDSYNFYTANSTGDPMLYLYQGDIFTGKV